MGDTSGVSVFVTFHFLFTGGIVLGVSHFILDVKIYRIGMWIRRKTLENFLQDLAILCRGEVRLVGYDLFLSNYRIICN